MRTKADLKARREMLGMSQQLFASILGVDVRSVKRWESPDAVEYKEAPSEAWDVIEGFAQQQAWVIETALDNADASGADEVSLTYWRSEAEYEAAHPGEGKFWQMANANSRLIAFLLEDDGYDVDFDFPGMGA